MKWLGCVILSEWKIFFITWHNFNAVILFNMLITSINWGNYILIIITLHCWLRYFAWSSPLKVYIVGQCLCAIFGYRTLQRSSSAVIWSLESVTALCLISARWVGSGTLPWRPPFKHCLWKRLYIYCWKYNIMTSIIFI